MRDLQTQLREYFDAPSPVTATEVFERAESRDRSDPWTARRVPGWVVAVAAAVVVLLIVGGVTIFRSSDDDVINEPTPTTVTTIGTTTSTTTAAGGTTRSTVVGSIPVGPAQPAVQVEPPTIVGALTTDSSLGPITWTTVEGPIGSIPSQIGPTDGGFAGWDFGTGRLMYSTDGAEWESVDQPAAGQVVDAFIGRGFVVATVVGDDGGLTAFESTDLIEWTPLQPPGGLGIDVSGPGTEVGVTRGRVVSTADATLTEWIASASMNWRALTLAYAGDDLARRLAQTGDFLFFDHDPAADRVVARLFNAEETVAEFTLRIRGTSEAWTIDVVDEASDVLVSQITGSLPEMDLASILDLAWQDRRSAYTVSTGDGSITVEPEWLSQDEEQGQALVTATESAFLALIRIGSAQGAGDTIVWRSFDGMVWEPVGSAPWSATEEPIGVAAREGVLFVDAWNFDQVYSLHRTEDGVAWSEPSAPPIPVGENPNGRTYAVAGGWVWLSLDGYSDPAAAPSGFAGVSAAVWTSPDGETWTPVEGWPVPAMLASPPPGGSGGVSSGVFGNTIFVVTEQMPDGGEGTVCMLIGEIGG